MEGFHLSLMRIARRTWKSFQKKPFKIIAATVDKEIKESEEIASTLNAREGGG